MPVIPIVIKFIGKGIGSLTKNLRGLKKGFGETGVEFRKHFDKDTGRLRRGYKLAATAGNRLALTTRNLMHGMRGFRMEMLGVMFFGMGMQKFFTGLLKPAAQLTGITKLFTDVLALFFLPILLELMPYLLDLALWFINASDSFKMFAGIFVLVGAAIGLILFLFGMFTLGIGSITMAIGLFGPTMLAVFGWIVVAVIAVVAVIVLLWLAFKYNILGMGDLFRGVWDGIVNIFMGAWEIIKGIWDVIAGIFTGDWKRVWEGVKSIFMGAWKLIVKGVGRVVWEILKWFWLLPWRIWKIIIKFTANLLKGMVWLWVHRDEWIPKVLDALKEAGKKMLEWAANIGKQIWDAILEKINQLKEWGGGIIRKITGGGTKNTEQTGGFIPHTGLYKLHAGETVNQAGFSSNPTIIINTAPGMDIDRLVSEVSDKISNDFESLTRR